MLFFSFNTYNVCDEISIQIEMEEAAAVSNDISLLMLQHSPSLRISPLEKFPLTAQQKY